MPQRNADPPRPCCTGRGAVSLRTWSSHLVPHTHQTLSQETPHSVKQQQRGQTLPLVCPQFPDWLSATWTRRAVCLNTLSSTLTHVQRRRAVGPPPLEQLETTELWAARGPSISRWCVFKSASHLVKGCMRAIASLPLTALLFPWEQWTPSISKPNTCGLELGRWTFMSLVQDRPSRSNPASLTPAPSAHAATPISVSCASMSASTRGRSRTSAHSAARASASSVASSATRWSTREKGRSHAPTAVSSSPPPPTWRCTRASTLGRRGSTVPSVARTSPSSATWSDTRLCTLPGKACLDIDIITNNNIDTFTSDKWRPLLCCSSNTNIYGRLAINGVSVRIWKSFWILAHCQPLLEVYPVLPWSHTHTWHRCPCICCGYMSCRGLSSCDD